MTTKTCTKCGETKPVGEFGRDKKCADGLNYWCRQCRRAYRAQEYKTNAEREKASAAQYYKTNAEKVRAARAQWRKSNPEKVKAWRARYDLANTEKRKASIVQWQKNNPERVKASKVRYRARRDASPTRRKRYLRDMAERSAPSYVPKVVKLCVVGGCGRRVHARGLCAKHYKEHHVPSVVRLCTIPGCDSPHRSRGLCNKHYLIQKRAEQKAARAAS